MRMLIYGGSFNPPHLGHLRMVEAAASAIGAEIIQILPDRLHEWKRFTQGTPSDTERVKLIQCAFSPLPQAEVLTEQLFSQRPLYTVELVELLAQRYPEAELFYLMGSDLLEDIQRWHRFSDFVRFCTLLVYPRDGYAPERPAQLRQQYGAHIELLEGAPMPVSSTMVRKALQTGKGRDYLLPSVYEEILKNQWYQIENDPVSKSDDLETE